LNIPAALCPARHRRIMDARLSTDVSPRSIKITQDLSLSFSPYFQYTTTTNQPTMNACLLTRDITRAPRPVPDAKEFLDLPKEGELYDAKTSQEKKNAWAILCTRNVVISQRPCPALLIEEALFFVTEYFYYFLKSRQDCGAVAQSKQIIKHYFFRGKFLLLFCALATHLFFLKLISRSVYCSSCFAREVPDRDSSRDESWYPLVIKTAFW